MVNLDKLDEADLKILRELQKDGRMSYAEISRKTGIPDSTVCDKIARLRKRGVIRRFTVILDNEKVGLDIAALIGVETGAELYRCVAEELSGLDELVEVYGTTAEFDLMVKVRTTSLKRLNEILNRIRSIKGVDDIFVMTILETFKEEHKVPKMRKDTERMGRRSLRRRLGPQHEPLRTQDRLSGDDLS